LSATALILVVAAVLSLATALVIVVAAADVVEEMLVVGLLVREATS